MDSENNITAARKKVDLEEISILLIGNVDERKLAISLIHQHLRNIIAKKIRKTALSLRSDEVVDVYQEVILNVLETVKDNRFDPDKPLLPFLLELAYCRAIDRIRKSNRKLRCEGQSELLDKITLTLKDTKVGEAWQIVASRNDGARLMEIILNNIIKLPGRQRQVASILMDRFPEEPTLEEIRNEIYKKTGESLTIVSIKGALQEVRRKIKEVLVDAGYMEEN